MKRIKFICLKKIEVEDPDSRLIMLFPELTFGYGSKGQAIYFMWLCFIIGIEWWNR
jgi:hypothetical protein